MAQKISKAPPAAESVSAAEQLATIQPTVELTLAGRKFTVREYGFFEGLEVAHRAQAFIADMHAMCSDGQLRYDRIRRLFGVHRDVVVTIAAQSANVEPEWIGGLARDDAETFMSAWFGVNAGFFVREVVVEMREERLLEVIRSTGSTSSSGSPTPDSATSTASDDSPNAS